MKEDTQNSSEQIFNTTEVCLYSSTISDIPLRLVSLNIDLHGALLHGWSRQFYANKYWKNNEDYLKFLEVYEVKIKRNTELLLMAYSGKFPIAHIEIYQMQRSILSKSVTMPTDAFGVHMLMGTYRALSLAATANNDDITLATLHLVLQFMFYKATVSSVYIESRLSNSDAIKAAEILGFKQLMVTDKWKDDIVLYEYLKDDYLARYPCPKDSTKFNLFADRFKP